MRSSDATVADACNNNLDDEWADGQVSTEGDKPLTNGITAQRVSRELGAIVTTPRATPS
jgi:hypothetical protein